MAAPKAASSKAKTTAKETPATAKQAPPRGIPAPVLKAAAVVAPTVSASASADTASAKPAAARSDAHVLKKQEMVDRVVKASGAKKKDVKLILEAALGVLGDALSAGEELNLPPFGKIKVNRQRDEGGAEVLILKLRRGGGSGGGGSTNPKEGLAEDGEDD